MMSEDSYEKAAHTLEDFLSNVTSNQSDAALLTIAAAIFEHAAATRSIAYGDNHGPTGLEALVMSISGKPGNTNLVEALNRIADNLEEPTE